VSLSLYYVPQVPPSATNNIIDTTWGKIRGSLNKNFPTQAEKVEEELKALMGEVEGATKGREQKERKKDKPTRSKSSWKSPILPVSDEKGYEVYGAYQYGRGLDIVEGGAFDTLLKQDISRLLSDEEVDKFIDSLLSETDKSKAAKQISATLSQRLTDPTQGGSPNFQQRLQRILDERKTVGNTFEEQLANAIVTRDNRQVVSNVPVRLSDITRLTTRDAACDCRGDTADIQILVAEEFNFLQVESPDSLSDSHIVEGYRKEMENKAKDWLARQSALRGETDASQTGVLIGSGGGDLGTISRAYDQLTQQGDATRARANNLRKQAGNIGS
jgi:hypothetical protein